LEKKGIMKAREIVDAHIDEINKRIEDKEKKMMGECRLNGISCIPYDFHEVWSIEDSNTLRDTLIFEKCVLLEELWGKLRKILDNCKDNCKRQGILIALRMVEEKMIEYKAKI